MNASLVLTIIGEDEPGLVEAVARIVTDHGGNWLESRMSHMAGKFAGVARVSVPRERAADLARALGALETRGLRLVVAEGGAAEDTESFSPVRLELVGTDHPGIVRDISEALGRHGVNIEELNTECISAPMSGERLFQASAKLRLPAGVSMEKLRQALEDVADNLMVDVKLETDNTQRGDPTGGKS